MPSNMAAAHGRWASPPWLIGTKMCRSYKTHTGAGSQDEDGMIYVTDMNTYFLFHHSPARISPSTFKLVLLTY